MGSQAGAKPCRVELLGGLRVVRASGIVTRFRTRKTGEILGRVAASLGRPVTREELLEEHWPETHDEQARNSLSQAVSSLRHLLEGPTDLPGSVLEATRASLCLRPEGCSTDLDDFRDALRRAESARVRGDEPGWESAAGEAAGLAQGELLPGASGLWCASAREAHREQATRVLEELGRRAAERGALDEALGLLLRAVENDPTRETLRQAAIQAFDQLGRPEAALRQYKQLARALSEELGVSPRQETKELVRGVVGRPRTAAPAPEVAVPAEVDLPPATTGPRSRLPIPASRFFGREAELRAVVRAVTEGAKLVTLLGPGGIGKTRLSLESARALEPRFPGRAWFSELAAATTNAAAWEELAASLGVGQSRAGAAEAALGVLSSGPALLVLDNYEQLAGKGQTEMVRRLMAQCPGLQLVATSRRRLDVEGEAVIEVPPLDVPPAGAGEEQVRESPGAALFLDRAQLVRPDFELNASNRRPVAELCIMLEGVPLAIELAASRVHVLSVGQMVERMDERLDLLASRGKAARHRSMRAAVHWTYDLLPPGLREAYQRLAVFEGGFTLGLAEALLRDPLAVDVVAELRDFSILTGGERPDGTIRFGMLEALREFARDAAGEEAWRESERRRLEAVLAFAEAEEPALIGPGQQAALGRLEAEHANIAGAITFAAAQGMADEALRLGTASWRMWHLRSRLSEGRRLLHVALETEGGGAVTRARALNGAGRLAYLQGDYAEAARLHEEALRLGGSDDDVAALAKNALGSVAYETGDYAKAVLLFQEALQMRRAMADEFGAANALSWLGIVLTDQGEYGQAREALDESLQIRTKIGDKGGVARSLNSLGIVARQTGRAEDAANLYTEALSIHRELGDQRAVAGALGNLAIVDIGLGRLDEAEALLQEAAGLLERTGDRWGIATNLAVQGQLALRRGDAQAALALQRDALRIRQAIGNRWGVALSLEAISAALAADQAEVAARLTGAASRIREEVGSPTPPADAAELEALAAALKDRLAAAYGAAFAEGQVMDDESACSLAQGELHVDRE